MVFDEGQVQKIQSATVPYWYRIRWRDRIGNSWDAKRMPLSLFSILEFAPAFPTNSGLSHDPFFPTLCATTVQCRFTRSAIASARLRRRSNQVATSTHSSRLSHPLTELPSSENLNVALPIDDFDDPNIDRDEALVGILGQCIISSF